jgi:predicted TIM-barrel fold metal-dependent hydrolase
MIAMPRPRRRRRPVIRCERKLVIRLTIDASKRLKVSIDRRVISLKPVLFDAHLHIVDPRFPVVSNHGYAPEPFTVADYRARTHHLGVNGGVVVSASFQGYDQTYLRNALGQLGPSFVGVAQVPAEIADEDVLALRAAGVRGFRANLFRGGAETLEQLVALAPRLQELAGWHAEVYMDAGDLPEIAGKLPERVVIDHLGLSAAGLPELLKLVERGAYVKATGFSRTDLDVPAALRAIAAINPRALLFGTDLPCTRAPVPFSDADIDLVVEALGGRDAKCALYDNAAELYLS